MMSPAIRLMVVVSAVFPLLSLHSSVGAEQLRCPPFEGVDSQVEPECPKLKIEGRPTACIFNFDGDATFYRTLNLDSATCEKRLPIVALPTGPHVHFVVCFTDFDRSHSIDVMLDSKYICVGDEESTKEDYAAAVKEMKAKNQTRFCCEDPVLNLRSTNLNHWDSTCHRYRMIVNGTCQIFFQYHSNGEVRATRHDSRPDDTVGKGLDCQIDATDNQFVCEYRPINPNDRFSVRPFYSRILQLSGTSPCLNVTSRRKTECLNMKRTQKFINLHICTYQRDLYDAVPTVDPNLYDEIDQLNPADDEFVYADEECQNSQLPVDTDQLYDAQKQTSFCYTDVVNHKLICACNISECGKWQLDQKAKDCVDQWQTNKIPCGIQPTTTTAEPSTTPTPIGCCGHNGSLEVVGKKCADGWIPVDPGFVCKYSLFATHKSISVVHFAEDKQSGISSMSCAKTAMLVYTCICPPSIISVEESSCEADPMATMIRQLIESEPAPESVGCCKYDGQLSEFPTQCTQKQWIVIEPTFACHYSVERLSVDVSTIWLIFDFLIYHQETDELNCTYSKAQQATYMYTCICPPSVFSEGVQKCNPIAMERQINQLIGSESTATQLTTSTGITSTESTNSSQTMSITTAPMSTSTESSSSALPQTSAPKTTVTTTPSSKSLTSSTVGITTKLTSTHLTASLSPSSTERSESKSTSSESTGSSVPAETSKFPSTTEPDGTKPHVTATPITYSTATDSSASSSQGNITTEDGLINKTTSSTNPKNFTQSGPKRRKCCAIITTTAKGSTNGSVGFACVVLAFFSLLLPNAALSG